MVSNVMNMLKNAKGSNNILDVVGNVAVPIICPLNIRIRKANNNAIIQITEKAPPVRINFKSILAIIIKVLIW